MSKYGTFSEPGYNSIGDPFEKKTSSEDRHGGLNFKAGGRRTGKNNDALFGRFTPLYQGEQYSKDYKEKQQERLESQKDYIQTAPFRPSNPQKASSGLGGYYGCLSKVRREARNARGDHSSAHSCGSTVSKSSVTDATRYWRLCTSSPRRCSRSCSRSQPTD